MRKIVAALLALALIASCSEENISNEVSEKEPAAMPREAVINNTRSWTSTDRSTFLEACRTGLAGNVQARKICNCVLEKMEKKYASLHDADEQGGDAAGAKAARECAGNVGYSEGFGNN